MLDVDGEKKTAKCEEHTQLIACTAISRGNYYESTKVVLLVYVQEINNDRKIGRTLRASAQQFDPTSYTEGAQFIYFENDLFFPASGSEKHIRQKLLACAFIEGYISDER